MNLLMRFRGYSLKERSYLLSDTAILDFGSERGKFYGIGNMNEVIDPTAIDWGIRWDEVR